MHQPILIQEDIIAEALFGEGAFRTQSKLVITSTGLIAGALLHLPETVSKEWEQWEVDVIIIPRRKAKLPKHRGWRVDQLVTSTIRREDTAKPYFESRTTPPWREVKP